ADLHSFTGPDSCRCKITPNPSTSLFRPRLNNSTANFSLRLLNPPSLWRFRRGRPEVFEPKLAVEFGDVEFAYEGGGRAGETAAAAAAVRSGWSPRLEHVWLQGEGELALRPSILDFSGGGDRAVSTSIFHCAETLEEIGGRNPAVSASISHCVETLLRKSEESEEELRNGSGAP
ncbi:hypothetical protein FCV25MIE_14446, partial [Fagus crenata]